MERNAQPQHKLKEKYFAIIATKRKPKEAGQFYFRTSKGIC